MHGHHHNRQLLILSTDDTLVITYYCINNYKLQNKRVNRDRLIKYQYQPVNHTSLYQFKYKFSQLFYYFLNPVHTIIIKVICMAPHLAVCNSVRDQGTYKGLQIHAHTNTGVHMYIISDMCNAPHPTIQCYTHTQIL